MKVPHALGLLFLSAPAFAATPLALDCMSTGKDRPANFAVNVNEGTVTITNLMPDKNSKKDPTIEMSLIGQAKMEMKYGAFVGKDPIVSFTSAKKAGEAHFEIATTPNSDRNYTAEFSSDHNSSKLICTTGEEFESFERILKSAKEIDITDMREFWDPGVAMSCITSDAKKYHIRAFSYGSGSNSMMFEMVTTERGPRPGGMSSFNELSFGKHNDLIFKSKEEMTIQWDHEKLERLYIRKKSKTNNLGQKVHHVTYVEDLKSPSIPMVEMSCFERQAFPVIAKFAQETKEMPKTFPETLGTLADVDHTLCGKENYDGIQTARDRTAKYRKLYYKMNLPADAHMNGYGVSNERKDEWCPVMEFAVSSQATADAIKGILGETIEGVKITYRVAKK